MLYLYAFREIVRIITVRRIDQKKLDILYQYEKLALEESYISD
jgi:hypothetical protein